MNEFSLTSSLQPELITRGCQPTRERSRGKLHSHQGVQTVSVALLLALTILVIHRVNERSYIGFHGLTHTAITFSVLEGNIPPTNPLAVDLPLPYYWGYHVLLAGIVRVFGCPPVAAAEAVNIGVILCLTVLLAYLGLRLTGHVRTGLFALALLLFAMNPFGPLLMLYDYLNGSLGLGVGAFTRSPTHPLLRAMFPHHDIRWIGAFFFHMQPSSRPLAMLAGMVTAALVCGSLSRVGLRRGIAIALVAAFACAMQPIVGTGTVFGLSVGLLALHVSRRKASPLSRATLVKLIASLGIGALLALPTYDALLNGDLVGLPLESSLAALGLKAVCVFGLLGIIPLTLTWIAFRRGFLERPELLVLAIAGITLTATSWVVFVPGHREHSFFNMGMYLLALPAAAACGTAHSARRSTLPVRRRRVLLAMTPVAGLMLFAFLYRQPIALAHEGVWLRQPRRARAMAMYDWIAKRTPPDAVIVFDTRDGSQLGFYGPESEIPAMTGRFTFLDIVDWFIPRHHPEVAPRQVIVASLFDGTPLTPDQVSRLRALQRPLYALCRSEADDAALTAAFGPSQYRAGKYTIHRLDLPGLASSPRVASSYGRGGHSHPTEESAQEAPGPYLK